MNAWWKMGIVLGWTIACVILGWHEKAIRCEVKDSSLQNQEDAAVIRAQNDVINTEAKNEKLGSEVSRDFQAKNAAIDALAERLQSSSPSSGHLPTSSNTPGGDHAAAAQAKLPPVAKPVLINLMKACDRNTQQLIACQAWISGVTR